MLKSMKLNHTNSQTCTHTYTQQSLVSAGKVAWRMLISWTGFECVWPCVGQKEPWDTETQQNWHWKQTEKKWGEGGMERRSVAGREGRRETNIWYHLEAALYAFTQKRNMKKNLKKRWEGAEKKGEGDGWMEGQTDGHRGGIWRARKLIIQLVCWVARGEEVMRATKGRPSLHPLPIHSFLLCSDVSSL